MSEVVRIDWMMLNIPTILVGVVTNPFKNSYFRGDAFSPTETISTCSGIYGIGNIWKRGLSGVPWGVTVYEASKFGYLWKIEYQKIVADRGNECINDHNFYSHD